MEDGSNKLERLSPVALCHAIRTSTVRRTKLSTDPVHSAERREIFGFVFSTAVRAQAFHCHSRLLALEEVLNEHVKELRLVLEEVDSSSAAVAVHEAGRVLVALCGLERHVLQISVDSTSYLDRSIVRLLLEEE